jgi:hypothetical protein
MPLRPGARTNPRQGNNLAFDFPTRSLSKAEGDEEESASAKAARSLPVRPRCGTLN